MKFSTRSTEKKKLLFWKSVSLEKGVLRKVVQTLSKFSSSRTNKKSSVQKIYSGLAVVELIKCCQFEKSIRV